MFLIWTKNKCKFFRRFVCWKTQRKQVAKHKKPNEKLQVFVLLFSFRPSLIRHIHCFGYKFCYQNKRKFFCWFHMFLFYGLYFELCSLSVLCIFYSTTHLYTEAATRDVLWKKVFLEISQNSQENTCARVSFWIKLMPEACNFIKKETRAQLFPVNFVKFLRTSFLQNTSGPLLLFIFIDLLLQQHFYFTSFAFLCSLLSTRNKIHFWLQSNKFFNCNDSGFIFRIFPITNLFELS